MDSLSFTHTIGYVSFGFLVYIRPIHEIIFASFRYDITPTNHGGAAKDFTRAAGFGSCGKLVCRFSLFSKKWRKANVSSFSESNASFNAIPSA